MKTITQGAMITILLGLALLLSGWIYGGLDGRFARHEDTFKELRASEEKQSGVLQGISSDAAAFYAATKVELRYIHDVLDELRKK